MYTTVVSTSKPGNKFHGHKALLSVVEASPTEDRTARNHYGFKKHHTAETIGCLNVVGTSWSQCRAATTATTILWKNKITSNVMVIVIMLLDADHCCSNCMQT